MDLYVISEYYWPDVFRINDITAQLAATGHNVTVLSGLPDSTTSKIPKEYKFFRRRKEWNDGVYIRRVPTIARRKGVFFRILTYSSFAINSFFYSLFVKKPSADVFFIFEVTPIFQAIPGVVFKKRTKKPLFLYCCDLWPESLKAWNIKETSLMFKIVKKISSYLYRACDCVMISSEPFREYLTEVSGVDPKKIVYLPQYAEDIFSHICGQYQDNGCIDFLFAGNIGAVQNIDCMIKAVPHINTSKEFKVHIVGDGTELEACRQLAQELNVSDKVVFHGRHPLSQMERFYLLADCFLLTLRGGDFIGKTLPGKAQSYLSAGKPLVCAADGASNLLVKDADCGLASSSGDYLGMAANMTVMIENFDEYKQKGLNGRKYYEKHFTREIFMDNFLKILNTDPSDFS